jgi:glycosyltransferase involved in cell wall biosynthesis
VSVGVFAYNHERYVVDAARSVVASTFTDWELFVVDDGSSDATAEVACRWAAELSDPRVSVVSDGENRGLASRLNEVAGRARGTWLAVLGGDDLYLPHGIEFLVEGSEPGVDVVWGDLEVMDEAGRSKSYARPRDTWQGSTARRYRHPGRPGADLLRVNNFVSGTSPLVRLSTLRAVGGYTPGARNEDLDLWLRLGHDHLFRYVDRPVARYRVVAGSSSRTEEAAVLDQARIVARMLQAGTYPREGLARLVAMRWVLSLARSRGKPPVSLRQVAQVSGLSRSELLRQAPRAGFDPIAMSATALVRRRLQEVSWHASRS